MKYLLALIILVSFLPLQSGLRCSMADPPGEKARSCRQETGSSDRNHASQKVENRSEVGRPAYHSDCNLCSSDLCSGFAVIKNTFFQTNNQELANVHCQQPDFYNFPMELFLLPPMDRAPPAEAKGTSNFLSYNFWQSYFLG